MADPVESAVQRFNGPYSCSQAVLAAFAPSCGLSEAQAVKLAAPFGGGMARSGHVCGAVSAALMVIGLARGSDDPADKASAYRLAGQFLSRFEDRHAGVNCRELIGFNMSLPEQSLAAKDAQVFTRVCPGFVRSAAEILVDLLD